MDWVVVVEGVGSVAAVIATVVAVVGAVSARADRNAAQAAAAAAERYARAAEDTATATRQIGDHLAAMVKQTAAEPLRIMGECLRNVGGEPVTVESILNEAEFAGRRPPFAVPVTIPAGQSIPLMLEQRFNESPVPASLSLSVEGRDAPVTLSLPEGHSAGEVWFLS